MKTKKWRCINKVYNVTIKTLGKLKRVMYGLPNTCIVHPSAQIIECDIEGRVKIDANTIMRNSEIGFGTFVGGNSNIARCKVGKYSVIGFKALVGGHPIHDIPSIHPALYSAKAQYGFTYVDDDSYQEFRDADEEHHAIVIGNDVWSTNVEIIQGITIGDGAVVMASAIVTKNVPPYAIVAGIPAKIIGYRFEPEDIEFLLKLRWWDRGEEWIQSHAQYFSSIETLKNVVLAEEANFWE